MNNRWFSEQNVLSSQFENDVCVNIQINNDGSVTSKEFKKFDIDVESLSKAVNVTCE